MRWRNSPLGVAGLLIALGINAWLLAVIATEVVSDSGVTADKVNWNPSLSASVGSVSSRKPIEAYKEILARPIFFRDRRPFVPTPMPAPTPMVAAPPPVVSDPGLLVGGVMITNDVRKAFVFSRAASANGAWTSEGGEFMGWRLKSITRTGAKLEQNGRSIDLQLYPKE